MSPERIPLVGHLQEKRGRVRPKTTCRKTVETELSVMGLSSGEAQTIAKDKTRYKKKGILMRPHAPLGAIRVDDDDSDVPTYSNV